MPVLSHGMRSAQVELAQAALNFHATGGDLRLTVDGKFGDQTKARTMSFQRAAGLEPDGRIGPLTEAKLLAAVQITGEIHYRAAQTTGHQKRALTSWQARPAFPQLTLPPLVSPRQPPRLVPQLTLSVPLVQGGTTFFPPQILRNPAEPPVQIFPIKATILQPIWHAPLVTEDENEETAQQFWARVLYQPKPLPRDLSTAKIEPYLKATQAPHPTIPDEEVSKVGGGIKIKLDRGGGETTGEGRREYHQV
jgi:peptidoglycan hydrolase-like protein with peptidoglycan-binding domain